VPTVTSTASFAIGPEQSFTITGLGEGTIAFTSAIPSLFSDFREKVSRKTFGPYGVSMGVAITLTSGTCDYTVATPDSTVTAHAAEHAAMNPFSGSHVRVAMLGDSITARTFTAFHTGIATKASAIAPWNWANWMVGAPFVLAANLAYAGDTAKGIFSRVSSVPANTQIVFVMAGTNDVANLSSSANQAAIDAAYTTTSGYIQQGVAALVAAGKKVVISTILPNGNLSSDTDSRIQLLDRLNAAIEALASPSSVWVVDGFTALWDSAQPTLRVGMSGTFNSGGDIVHPTSAGAQLFGAAAIDALKEAYAACTPDVSLYDGYQPQRVLYSEFRRSTGGSAGTISAGSGTIADGWRCLQNAGTATFTVDATTAYSVSNNYVGQQKTAPASVDSYWQKFNVTAAANNDNPRLRLPANTDIINTGTSIDGIFGGSEWFMEVDVLVEDPVNLKEIAIGGDCFFTLGTSPIDQSTFGATFVRVEAGTSTDSSSTATAVPAGYRATLRTPVMRVPENVNATVDLQLIPFLDIKFLGAGSATVSFGRPRMWHKAFGRIG